MAASGTTGYGQFNAGKGSRRATLVHRYSWELENGPTPTGSVIRHAAGCTRLCVRPSHLSIGTQQDNMDDKVLADRQQKGEGVWNSCLTEEQVRAIRMRYLAGESGRQIARSLKIYERTIYNALTGDTWRHIEDPPPVVPTSARLTPELAREARGLASIGWPCAWLAEFYEVDPKTVRAAVTGLPPGKPWTEIMDPPPLHPSKLVTSREALRRRQPPPNPHVHVRQPPQPPT